MTRKSSTSVKKVGNKTIFLNRNKKLRVTYDRSESKGFKWFTASTVDGLGQWGFRIWK